MEMMDIDIDTRGDEEAVSAAPKNKLGLCEVCGKDNAKYCCPRCEVKTCSLSCSKIHKQEVECSGIRDRAKFIHMNKFTNLDMSSDYRLLEEITRAVETSKKTHFSHKYPLSKRFFLLQRAALERKVSLKFLPNKFIRHMNNTSIFDRSKGIIEWHVDWVFVNCENLKISEKVSENVRISKLVSKYLVKQDCKELQGKLQYYQAADLPGIKILLKAEQKSGKKFYEIDPLFTLKEVLKNKNIIEYPTIHLTLKDQATFCDIIDSDDEDCDIVQNQVKSGREVINKIIKKAESNDSLHDPMKNLMFLQEYSDEDGE